MTQLATLNETTAVTTTGGGRGGVAKSAGLYSAMIVVTVGAFLAVCEAGRGLVAPTAAGASTLRSGAAAHGASSLTHLLLALLVVIGSARLLGAVFRYFHQPAVMGEVIAGIVLGPSLLGRLAPDVSAVIFPTAVVPSLGVVAQVGVILYMFLVGLELDIGALGKKTHTSVAISHASIVTPFLLGGALALWMYPRFSTADVPFTVFALFLGVSMSVTAFPVLARILTDRKMQRSSIGIIALTCAAVDDVTAWCLLAFVVGVANADAGSAVPTVLLTAAFMGIVWFIVRPFMGWVARRHEMREGGNHSFAIASIALLLAALATEVIGIHALFGAFLVGAVMPADSKMAHDIKHKLEEAVLVLLLPAFFAIVGLRTQIGLVEGLDRWLVVGLVVVVASLGKFGGSAVAARFTGLDWHKAASIGILMNTRGLMELIVLNIGLDLGVLSPTLFAILVLMALITTLATTPLLHLLNRRGSTVESGAHDLAMHRS